MAGRQQRRIGSKVGEAQPQNCGSSKKENSTNEPAGSRGLFCMRGLTASPPGRYSWNSVIFSRQAEMILFSLRELI